MIDLIEILQTVIVCFPASGYSMHATDNELMDCDFIVWAESVVKLKYSETFLN